MDELHAWGYTKDKAIGDKIVGRKCSTVEKVE